MARGVNKVILLGNLGDEPDVRYDKRSRAIVRISLATSKSWKDKDTNERQERTEWHRVVFFGNLASIASEYLRKGSQAYIEGELQTRKWQDNNGNDRYTTEVVAGELQLLGKKSDEPPPRQQIDQPKQSGFRKPNEQPQQDPQPAPQQADGFPDDDIPFAIVLPAILAAASAIGLAAPTFGGLV